MKKLILLSFLLSTSLAWAQSEIKNYQKPIIGLGDYYSSNGLFRNKNLTRVDLAKLNYRKEVLDGKTKYSAEIAFYLRYDQEIDAKTDFIFLQQFAPLRYNWSILDAEKKSLPKNFQTIRQGEQKVGSYQTNDNLIRPITEPGEYFLKIMLDEIPTESIDWYVLVGRIHFEMKNPSR